MASLCTRCALRLRRAADSVNGLPPSRYLSTTRPARSKALPSFSPTSNPELDSLFHDFRYKHFLPAVLEKPQWDLVFRSKNKNFLEENPQSVNVGDEDIKLEHLGGIGVMPNRKKQLVHVMRLLENGEPGDWINLPALLRGLHMMGKDPPPRVRAKIVRLATKKGQFGTILACLRSANSTGLTLKDPETLEAVIWALRSIAEQEDWSEEAIGRAIVNANEVASQLESDAHGSGKQLSENDPRRSPYILGVFLELAAVYAWRFKERKDVDDKVAAYAGRLLSNISESDEVISGSVPELGPVTPMRHYAPILHGLKLAERMLGESMPQKDRAREIIQSYESGLAEVRRTVEEKLKAQQKPYEYGEEALRIWRSVHAED